MKSIKEANYVNDIGHLKKIIVYKPKNGLYPFSLWSMQTGDFCGSGEKTRDELNEFFAHYKINESIGEEDELER